MRTACGLTLASVSLVLASALAGAEPAKETAEVLEFRAFLQKIDEAQVEFARSRPAAFKALWSHGPEVTIFGGFGAGEHGWAQVGPRLDWASAQFSEGVRTREIVHSAVMAPFGYVVQRETIRYKVPGKTEEKVMELRVTMILRKATEGWRIVHRHADSQVSKKAP